jgi:hypothetical protein
LNNTRTRTLAAIVLIFTAITLVAGGTLTAATSTAFAYQNKGTHYNGKGNNGDTNTIQVLKQKAKTRPLRLLEQNGQNLICTESSSTCSTQGDDEGVDAFIASNNRNLIRTLGDQWWNWALSIDTSKVGNPFNDTTGALCDLGRQPGNLLFLVGTAGEFTNTTSGETQGHTGDVRICETPVPRGTNIFFPIFNTECSVLETPCAPLPACPNDSSEDVLRACAVDLVNHVDKDSLKLIIDGVPLKQLAQSFRVQSGPGGFQLTIVPNNPFISGPESPLNVNETTTTTSVSDGYWVLLRALRPGPHTITFGANADFPEFDSAFRTLVTYEIVVE